MALIFYAEDDSLMGELVQATLLDAGHAVGVLGDGEDALRALRRRKPDLAIVDMAMPQISGSELIKIVRRDPDLDTAGEPGTGPVAIIADGGTTTPSPSTAPTRGATGDQHEDAR